MSYVENNLMSGEKVIYKANIHWIVYVPGIIIFLLGLFLLSFPDFGKILDGSFPDFGKIFGRSFPDFGKILGGAVFGLAFISFIKSLITKMTTELAVTSKRVIAKFGLIRRNTIELNHSKVESFNIDQSIMGRILGFGTLTINGTGGGKTPIPNIDSPLDFRRKAMQAIDSSQ